jgi:transcriptional regulator with XRE-family HTH domain
MNEDEFYRLIMKKIDRLRESNKLTKKDFAETILLSPVQYSKLIKGTQRIKIETLHNIQNIYGISIDYIVSDLAKENDISLTGDQSFLSFIKQINDYFDNENFTYDLIVKELLSNIIGKMKIKEYIYKDQRPLFLFRKILKNLENIKIEKNAKELLINEIMNEKKDLHSVRFLIHSIEELDNFECFNIIRNKQKFITALENLATTKLDVIANDMIEMLISKLSVMKK